MFPPIYIYEILKIYRFKSLSIRTDTDIRSYIHGKDTKQKLATNRTKNISLSTFNTLSEHIIQEITTYSNTYQCLNI